MSVSPNRQQKTQHTPQSGQVNACAHTPEKKKKKGPSEMSKWTKGNRRDRGGEGEYIGITLCYESWSAWNEFFWLLLSPFSFDSFFRQQNSQWREEESFGREWWIMHAGCDYSGGHGDTDATKEDTTAILGSGPFSKEILDLEEFTRPNSQTCFQNDNKQKQIRKNRKKKNQNQNQNKNILKCFMNFVFCAGWISVFSFFASCRTPAR